jgi:phosphoglycolate phosphatase-like HAD superfamily hydrolase
MRDLPTRQPELLVLDFDGVVCDGMGEFCESAARAWESLNISTLPASRRDELQARFARLRPVVEAGWEMAILPAIIATTDAAQDVELHDPARWAEVRDAHVTRHGLARDALARALDTARDIWCREDHDGWLRCHRFYPGIGDWLKRLLDEGHLVYILSTKEKRFLDDLLAWQEVPLPPDRIIGKASPRRAKWEVIQALAARHGLSPDGQGVWFVEDRFATLLEFRSPAAHLAAARLFLAEWGYVFPHEVESARAAGIPTLTLAQATGPFAAWPRSALSTRS